MNFLGHALLSFDNELVLTGNMIGDYVKGRIALENYPPDVKKGILLHRKIDVFTDDHPATARAKVWFSEAYGLYSGALMDAFYDHFLANDAKYFSSETELKKFSLSTYAKLQKNVEYMPEKFRQFFPYMVEHDWLYNYRTLPGVQRMLHGLSRRASHMPPVDKAYEIFITHYYQLAQCYYEFMDDVAKFARLETEILE